MFPVKANLEILKNILHIIYMLLVWDVIPFYNYRSCFDTSERRDPDLNRYLWIADRWELLLVKAVQ